VKTKVVYSGIGYKSLANCYLLGSQRVEGMANYWVLKGSQDDLKDTR